MHTSGWDYLTAIVYVPNTGAGAPPPTNPCFDLIGDIYKNLVHAQALSCPKSLQDGQNTLADLPVRSQILPTDKHEVGALGQSIFGALQLAHACRPCQIVAGHNQVLLGDPCSARQGRVPQ